MHRWKQLRAAYAFTDLQSFLDIYYAGASVLLQEQDFYDMTAAYLARAHADHVRHAEIFFDPQTHTARGVPFETVINGIWRACQDGPISATLIMCFLRHLSGRRGHCHAGRGPAVSATRSSASASIPPSAAIRRKNLRACSSAAAQLGLHLVAHAGEEGPPAYIETALDLLNVERIDHGVRCLEDPAADARAWRASRWR